MGKDMVLTDETKVRIARVNQSKGVIHVVDSVLLPQ
jgi:uncharacterized surface protein with fasciclin (FAS1) repeats